MRLPHAEDLAHLSDADRFKEVMKRLVSVTPEQFSSEQQRQEEAREATGKQKPGRKPKSGPPAA